MKLSTFIVFAYFCTLFIVKIIKESMILVQTFGNTTILIKGYEAVTVISIIGVITTCFLIVKICDWIFFDKEYKESEVKEQVGA